MACQQRLQSSADYLLMAFIILLSMIANAVAEETPLYGPRLSEGYVEHLIPIEGGELCCVQRRGRGPTLMLIPGTFSDSRVFRKLIPHLDPHLNLLLLENRGLGKSHPKPTPDVTIETLGQDALKVADHLKIDKFFVSGHSLGGMISIEVAGAAPERLLGVLSLEGWTNWQAARDAFDFDMKSTLSPSELEESRLYREDTLADWTKEEEKAFAQLWRRWDGSLILKSTKVSVLEIYGTRNRPPATRQQLHIPERDIIELVWIEGAAHKVHLEEPKQVGELMNRFIRTKMEK
ncbi:1H-3-hydroxy-4-oxoquinaldine 2,4-dioxygenase [Polystyrenella longa]|uniref:1H-3-hydroxy-4-oxoquinaldine 2,4-dioxygenase n=1 Tax=Polystyrenella longa TaxID=2528007 RepID=A0A518CLF5_9PLAN|nr:alpha/beta hydrolase [Polystyrenella longa]QDU80004.1 1H-3-hydroxy-4-oxoquinaldine 2,4-dioxygenase [Polystyrenella longa]